MPTVDFESLSARYPGGIPESDKPRAEAALEDASAAVRNEAGLAAAETIPAALAPLTLRVARREYANPLRRDSETLADYSWSGSESGAGAALTRAERAEVRRVMGLGDIVSVRTPMGWDTRDVQQITPTEPDGWTLWRDWRES